ncbi:MAG: LacI family transcriptional regulator [Lentisphaerae bacterium]|nr:LacI family transcriptional regulator [Lentisphaerota bacterium]MCP4101750.1 LacI family transcriptional regulator [Lentisphaerota bacterium]
MFPDDDVFYYKIFAELEKSFNESGLHPIVHLTHNIRQKEENILDFLIESNVDAIIAVPNAECSVKYAQLKIPLLFFDLSIDSIKAPSILSDDYEGAARAVEYLLSIGHSKIAFIGSEYDPTSANRLNGFIETLKNNNLTVNSNFIKCKEATREWDFYAAQELLSANDKPTAIFCSNDTIAAGVFRFTKSKNVRIPEDVSLLGFGNTAIAEDLELTSVSQHSAKIVEAIRKNLDLILCGNKPPDKTRIGTSLIVRNSTASPLK